jgi:hypothetical protein
VEELTSKLYARLQDYTIPGFNFGEEFISPRYEDQSIMNIPSTVCKWMGLPGIGAGSLHEVISSYPGDRINKIILILMDGLQYNRFLSWSQNTPIWKNLINQGMFAPITSVVPSTTSSALTTLWTGLSPAAHGIIGYEMWLKEFSMVGNMITHAPMTFRGSTDSLELAGFSAEEFLNMARFGTHLSANGIKPYAFSHYSIANSGLSRMLMQDVEVVPFQTPASMWIDIRYLIDKKVDERMYIWTYWGQLDGISHYYGPDDERVSAEFAQFSNAFEKYFLKKLDSKVRSGTMLILTADHGQTYTPLKKKYILKNHPELNRHLRIKPTCENRLAFLHLRPGSETYVTEYINQKWPGVFTIISHKQALDQGLFGPGEEHPNLRDRTGDLIVIAQDGAYLWWADEPDFLLGRHGSMTKEDMVVPFLAVQL